MWLKYWWWVAGWGEGRKVVTQSVEILALKAGDDKPGLRYSPTVFPHFYFSFSSTEDR